MEDIMEDVGPKIIGLESSFLKEVGIPLKNKEQLKGKYSKIIDELVNKVKEEHGEEPSPSKITETVRAELNKFSYAPTALLSTAIEKQQIDCDIACFIAGDVLRRFGYEPTIVFVPGHASLEVSNFRFEALGERPAPRIYHSAITRKIEYDYGSQELRLKILGNVALDKNAVSLAHTLISKDPKSPYGYLTLHDIYCLSGNYQAALEVLNQAIDKEGIKHPLLYYARAGVKEHLGLPHEEDIKMCKELMFGSLLLGKK